MGRGTLGAAQSRTSLGRPSMGPPGRWLAYATWSLGTWLERSQRQPPWAMSASRNDLGPTDYGSAVESPRVGAGLGDQHEDDGDDDHADESAAELDRRLGS